MNQHEELQTRIAAYLIDGLPATEVHRSERELLEHLPGCEECRDLMVDLREVASELALAAQPVAPSAHMDAAMRRAISEEPRLVVSVSERKPRRALAVALVAALLALPTTWALNLAGRLDQAEREARASTALEQLVSDPAVRTVSLAGKDAAMTLVYKPGSQGVLLADRLSPPPQGKVFELWFIRSGTPVPVDVFRPQEGRVRVDVSSVPRGAEVVAVTVEDRFVSQPTTAPIFVGTLA
ncbi:MAG: anti-sigma factor domain-containing protein [Actinomycetota bacterium]